MSEVEENKQTEKRLEVALQGLTREINLFWQRALFFWGLIAAAFVAYAALLGKSQILLLLIAGFGMVCSVAWSLANRGNKFWQEAWEQKVERAEESITGRWVGLPEVPLGKGMWRGRTYSVSKLAIAVSDYMSAVWLFLFLHRVLSALRPLLEKRLDFGCLQNVGIILACVAPPVFLFIVFRNARSSPPIG